MSEVFKCIEFPERDFSSKTEMFKALKRNENKIIQLKKAQIYKGSEKGQVSFLNGSKIKFDATKAGFEAKENFIYPIISTTNFYDSHKDVHFNNCFNRTVKNEQGKVMYALDHELKYDSVLAWPKDVEMFIASIPWGMVGKSFEGETEALVFGISKDSITRKDVLDDIENKVADFENSIRMIYYKIVLGINSEEKELAENKIYYDSKIDLIANKEDVAEEGYFWGVEELGIHKEGSLVVAGGSNSATSIYSKNIDSSEDTQEEDSPVGTPKTRLLL